MVWVFKTSVQSRADIASLASSLNGLLQHRGGWNFDLEDCDNILRVESTALQSEEIIRLLQDQGYFCAELEDDVALNRA
jgi:hypothetical protein